MKTILLLLLSLFAVLFTEAKDDLTVKPIPDDERERLDLDAFYQKRVVVGGFSIVGSKNVSNYALSEAGYLIRQIVGNRDDLLNIMNANKTRLTIMAIDEYTTDVPEHSHLYPDLYWDKRARGLGADPDSDRPCVSCGEENLIEIPGDPYETENILIHEFAHAFHIMGLNVLDSTFQNRLEEVFSKAIKKGLWKDTYAASNVMEYWAEGVQSWYGSNRQNDFEHNHVNTRKELQAYDPALAKLIEEVLGTRKWVYRKPSERKQASPHMKGFDLGKKSAFHWPRRLIDWQKLFERGLVSLAPENTPEVEPLPIESKKVEQSGFSNRRTEFFVHNYSIHSLQLEWVNFEGKLSQTTQLRPGDQRHMNSFATHVWQLSEAETRKPIARYVLPQAKASQLNIGNAHVLSALATKPKAKPNVLFVAVDDLNADLGCYGHPLVHSPNIDRLAKSGLRFDRAYCQYPVCNPSRSSFLTGLYPEQTGVLSNAGNFRNRHPELVTLPQLFKNNGYHVSRIGKLYHYGVPLQIGTAGEDDPASWHETVNPIGIDRTELEPVETLDKGKYGGTISWRIIDSKDEEHTDGQAALEAISLLEKNHPKKTGKPFFLALGFYRPHTPYVAPTHHAKHYPLNKIKPILEKDGDRDDIPRAALPDRPHQRDLSVEKRKEIIQAYYASTTLMDACLGRVLGALEKLKLKDNTIVVFLSDHGYHLGHHGLWQKSDLFEGSTRVPLIISVPGMTTAGMGTSALTELVDLYPTLADLCSLTAPPHLMGDSLLPILQRPLRKGKDAAYTVTRIRPRGFRTKDQPNPLGRTVRTKRYRYTEWLGGKHGVELYDYLRDPQEFYNLAEHTEHQKNRKELSALLHKKHSETEQK
tara:strand:- start:74 stop:2677 length:2604 start_codon:yes stop_codon:yes gene_type:complete